MTHDYSIRLSPSAINTYFRSPRLFYYQYVMKLESPPNIHLYKGSFVHKVLEELFLATRYVPVEQYCMTRLKEWNPPQAILTHMSEKDKTIDHFAEVEKMLAIFARRFEDKIDMIMLEGKAKDKSHAWNLLKPKLREYKIQDKERNVTGIIDSVETSYDETTYLVDYKTSKLYRHTLPEDYVRQLSIYAYLFQKEFGKLPNFAAIHYLRYGEVFIIPVTEETVNRAIKDIEYVREKTQSRNIEDYPKGNDEFANKECEYYEQKLSRT